MRKSIRVALVGTAGAVVLTAVSVMMPTGTNADPVGVEQSSTYPTFPKVSPFPPTGTVPVVTPSPSKSSEAPSKRPAANVKEKTRESVSASPSTSQKRVRDTPRASSSQRVESSTPKKTATPKPVPKVTTISGYSWCGSGVSNAQPCIDAGKLTLYYPAGVATLAGHNYMGWYWMDDLPVGRTVVIKSGSLAGTYVVYAHGSAARGSAGGKFPAAGYGAAVALQTCTNTGTGFSFLRRA